MRSACFDLTVYEQIEDANAIHLETLAINTALPYPVLTKST